VMQNASARLAALSSPFAAFAGDGTRVVTANPERIWQWNVARTPAKGTYLRMTTTTYPKISRNRAWVALPDDVHGVVWLWRVDQKKLRKPTSKLRLRIRSAIADVEIDGTGGRIAVGNDGGHISVWSRATRKPIGKPFGLGGETFALSPDGSEVVGAAKAGPTDVDWVTDRGTVTSIWNVDSGKRVVVHTRDQPSMIAFSPLSDLFVTGSDTTAPVVWDARSGEKVAGLPARFVQDFEFDPQGRFVVTASDDGTAQVWLARTGGLLATFHPNLPATPARVAFSPNGRKIVVGDSEGSAAIFTCRTCGGAKQLLDLAKNVEPSFQVATPAKRSTAG